MHIPRFVVEQIISLVFGVVGFVIAVVFLNYTSEGSVLAGLLITGICQLFIITYRIDSLRHVTATLEIAKRFLQKDNTMDRLIGSMALSEWSKVSLLKGDVFRDNRPVMIRGYLLETINSFGRSYLATQFGKVESNWQEKSEIIKTLSAQKVRIEHDNVQITRIFILNDDDKEHLFDYMDLQNTIKINVYWITLDEMRKIGLASYRDAYKSFMKDIHSYNFGIVDSDYIVCFDLDDTRDYSGIRIICNDTKAKMAIKYYEKLQEHAHRYRYEDEELRALLKVGGEPKKPAINI